MNERHKDFMKWAKAKLYPYLYRKPLDFRLYLSDFNARRAEA